MDPVTPEALVGASQRMVATAVLDYCSAMAAGPAGPVKQQDDPVGTSVAMSVKEVDDYLAGVDEPQRADYLAKLVGARRAEVGV